MMASHRPKECLSSWHLGIMVASTAIGSQIILFPRQFIEQTGHGAWISVLLGGIISFGAAYLILKLADRYPDETMVSYFLSIWGRVLGSLFVLLFFLTFIIQFISILRGFSKMIAYTMFVRTPEESVAYLFLAVCAYGALQDWRTIARIQQIIFFTSTPLLIMFFLISLLNFHTDLLLPLWPENPAAMLKGVIVTWNFYSGFEIILLIFPLVCRLGISKIKTVGLAFAFMTGFFVMVILFTIGVLSVNTASSLSYPTLELIKGIEIPGTFVERLEIYMLLFWIPIVFDSMIVFLAGSGYMLAEYFPKYSDHRLWILALLPIIGIATDALDKIEKAALVSQLTTWMGVTFVVAVVPLTLLLSIWKGPGRKCGSDAPTPS